MLHYFLNKLHNSHIGSWSLRGTKQNKFTVHTPKTTVHLPKTSYIYYSPLHYHYIFVDYVLSKEESLELLKKVRAIESDVCLLLNVIE